MYEMLKLSYIICGKLPKYEEKYLYDNMESKNDDVKIVRESKLKEELTSVQNPEKVLQELAGSSVFISSDRGELYRAARAGMATICYLPPQANITKLSEESLLAESMPEETSESITPEETSESIMPEETSESITLEETSESVMPEEYSDFSPDMYVEGFEEVDLIFLQHVYERHHHIPWTILETKRCIVKEFSMEYLDALFELYDGEGMTDYMEPLYPYEQEKEYQQAYIDNMYAFYGYGMWIVCEKETGRLIGRVGVEHREELGGELELGYAIGIPYQRQGYATEVCEAVLTYTKEELGMPSVCCLIDEGNVISEHLAAKLGFSFEETVHLQEKFMKKYRMFL